MDLFIARDQPLPPSCVLTIPFLAVMNLNYNNFDSINGDSVLKAILTLIFEYKPILSLVWEKEKGEVKEIWKKKKRD